MIGKYLRGIILFYILTRIPFLRHIPVYYDSFEYLRIAGQINFGNLSEVLISSHQPVHTFYFLLILFFKKIFFFLQAGEVLTLISLIFGLLITVLWFNFLGYLTDRKTAFFSAMLLSIFPYFYVVTTNIFYEAPLLFFQLLAFYFLHKFFKQEKIIYLIFGGIFLGLAVSIFIGSLFIFPLYLTVYFMQKNIVRKKIIFLLIFYVISIITAIFIDLLIFKSPAFIFGKYLSHVSDFTSSSGGSLIFIFRIIRNVFVQFSSILSIGGMILLILAIFSAAGKRKVNTPLGLLLFLPAFVLTQYWHAGLYGRLSLYIIFPVSYFLSFYYRKNLIRLFIFFIIFVFTLKIMSIQYQIAPIYRYYGLYKNTAKSDNVAIVTSDYNRFLYQTEDIPLFIVNGEPENGDTVEEFINWNLAEGNQVVVDSAAIRYPYFQYDGDFIHLLSKNYKDNSVIKDILKHYNTEVWARDFIQQDIYFLKLTRPALTARIKKLNTAYDRTDSNTSFWRSHCPDNNPGFHRLADLPNPLRNPKNADEV